MFSKQGTARAIWESLDATRTQALHTGLSYTQLSNPIGKAEVDRSTMPANSVAALNPRVREQNSPSRSDSMRFRTKQPHPAHQ